MTMIEDSFKLLNWIETELLEMKEFRSSPEWDGLDDSDKRVISETICRIEYLNKQRAEEIKQQADDLWAKIGSIREIVVISDVT